MEGFLFVIRHNRIIVPEWKRNFDVPRLKLRISLDNFWRKAWSSLEDHGIRRQEVFWKNYPGVTPIWVQFESMEIQKNAQHWFLENK